MKGIFKFFPALSVMAIEFIFATPVFADLTYWHRQMEAHQEKVNYLIIVAIIQLVIIAFSLFGLRKLKRWKDETHN